MPIIYFYMVIIFVVVYIWEEVCNYSVYDVKIAHKITT